MERLIAIVGPTAVGKTKVSIDLAKLLHTEIISGDSMLVYRGMDIGTAKPSIAEQDGIIHHLVNILDPSAEFNVVDFQILAGQLITAINGGGKIPVLAGGTGLYVKALLEGYSFNTAPGNEELRTDYLKLAESRGREYLHSLLAKKDPATASRLHPNDLRRVIRALEVISISGEQVSQTKTGMTNLMYDVEVIGLISDRAKLYQRINERVDKMFAAGLVDEVAGLLAQGIPYDCQAMKGIGYKETAAYLRNEVSLEAAVDRIKQATRNFAKRQLTWFRKMPYIHWVDIDDFDNYNKMLAYIYSRVAGKFELG